MPSKVERWLASKAKKQEGTATDKIRADRAIDSGSEEFRVGAELDRYVGKASALTPYSPAPTTEQPTYVEQTPLERKEQKLVSAARQRAEKRKTAGDDFYKKEYGMTKAEYDKEYDAIDRMSAVREARSNMQEIEDTAKARTEEKVALAPLVKEYKDAFIGILPESAYAWHSPVGDKEEIKEDIVLDYLMTLPAEERYAQLEKAAYRSTIVPRIEALKEKATQFMNEESERITAMQKHVPVPSYSDAAGMQLGASGTWESPVEYLEDLYTSVKKDDFKSGFVEAADWRDFISFGLASLGGDAAKLQALQKAYKGEPLTEQDEFFIEVAEIEQALEDFRKEKGGASFLNSLGSGAAHSSQFLTEMLMTGGLGGAAKVATSGIKQAFKQGVGRGLAHLAVKNVPKTLAYGAKRSPLMAGTYRNLMDRRINQYSVANGQVDLTNPESLWKSIGVAWADQTFEIASELWGNMLHLGFGKIGKAIGADKWLKTKSVSLKTTPAMRRIFRDGLLWSGDIPSEMTSEFLGDVATNLAYSAFNKDEQYWGELFTRDYWGNLLALTAGLKAGVTVASIPSIVDSNKKMKQLEARSAEAFNAIGNEELKNKVLNLGGRTDIEDVAEYMHSIELSQYKPIEVAHAIDYMMSEVERQVVAGSESEQERAERYAPRLKRIKELAYLNAEGVAMPTMVTADVNFGADDTKSVTIIQGDYNNPEAMVWVRLADGTTKAVVGEKISNVQETDMALLVAEDYAMTFAEEDAMETLGEVEQTLFDMQRTGASNTQQIRAVEKAGLTVFNEGEVVTLLNGEEATVVEGFRHGLYTVMRADGSLSMVGVGGILQPDVAIAQAQRSAAMPQEQTPLTQSAPLPEDIDTTTDYATPDGFVGKAVDYNAESDQVTLQSADGGLTNVPRASLTTANAEQIAPQEDITENLATETISEMEQGEAEEAPMPVAPQTAPIPQNEDGSVDYESMTDATMYANALESDMGNVADAQEAVADVRQSKEAELAKLQEQKQQTANMNEKVALKQQEQKLVQQIAMLNEVENILGSRATAVEAETAQVNEAVETAPVAEATTEQTAPTTEQKKPTEPTRAEVEGVKDNYLATQLRNENPAEYNIFNALAKLLGLEIEFVESAGEGNALIVGNKMQVAYNPANREETLRFLIGHESLHRLKQVAPEAYAELMEDVKSYIGEELFGQRVERLRVRYEHQGIAITEESLEEEVVADFIGEMEEDYNVVSDLVTNNPNKSWWQKLIEGLRNLFAFLEAAEADTTKVASILNKIETAYKTAAEKVQTLEVETVNGEVSAEINEAEGQAKLSIRTYEEGGRVTLVDFLQKQQAKDALTAEEADDILAQMDNLYTICKEYKDKYAPFGQWSDASVVVGEDGKPVFSVIKKNGEYAMNLDFSLVCKKRRTLDAVLNEMVKRGLIEGISVSETTIAKINEVIRRYGFETACALCFVDARRFRVLKVAKDFADLYNSVVDKLIPKGSNIAVNEFNYGGREDVVEKENALDTMADESLNISALQKMSEGKSVKARIARHLLDNPQDRKYVTPSDFVSTAGFDNVAANNVPLLKLYNAKKGTGGPKAAFSDVQYLNDIAKKNWSVEDAFAVGGVRIQSFSDFVPRMVFDYMQMVAELAGKKLPAHAYTKEAIFAKMFGLTGVKINLSLVPDVVEGGVAAGLDANGDYVWRDGETFPYEEAVALQNAEGYKENCGTIAVGVSDEHILKMLDDPHIRMVIPYHKSGLNPLVAKMNNIGAYKDYTKEQSTRTAKGNSRTKEQKAQLPEPSFNELLRESNSPMEAAQKYLDWCKEHNLKPKFDRFASHPNYYKLLEDFTTYVDGAYVPQRSVTMTYPTAENAFGSISELIAQGLEEDAILEGQRDAKVSQMVDEIEGAKFSLRNPEWQSQFGVPLADGKELSLEDVRTLFERTNKRKVLQQMFDKVYEVMEKLPYYGIIVTSQMPEGSEDSLGVADGKGNILLNVRMFQEISNKGIATTILHEMIHSATTYATIAYEERKENPEAYEALPENIKTACQRLQNIYDFLLKRKNLKEEYGMTSIHEMLAELSNPQFRALLREEGVWEKLVNALKRFFGIGTGKTVKELDETLKTFLENFDRSAYVETVEAIAGEKVFERKVDAKEADAYSDVMYSLKSLDAPYLDAVERGDMATAERLVREAAAIAMPNTMVLDEDGLPKVVYHQTNATVYINRETGQNWDELDWRERMEWDERDDWDEYWEEQDFNTFSRVNARTTNEFDGFFFAPEYDEYHEYGDRTIRAFLDIRKPASREEYNIDSSKNDAGRDERIRLQSEGYDGVIREEDGTIWEYIAFEPNQIKSADVVTYDDAGNIIPLSERFNPNKEDIRYSLREATSEEVKEYLADALRAAYADRLEQIDKRYDYIADTAKKGRRPFIIGDMDAALALADPDGKEGLPLELQIAYDIANGLKFRWADSEGGIYKGLQEAIGDRKSVAGILDAQEGAYLNEYATRLAEQVGMSAEDVQKVVVNVVRNNPSRKAAIKTLGKDIPFEYNERVEQVIEDSRARAKGKVSAEFEAALNSPDGNTPYARLMQDEAVEIVRASDVLRDMRAEIRGLRKKHAESKYEQAVRIEKVRKRITDMVGTYFGRNMNAAEIKTLVNLISKAHTPEALERALDMIQRQEFNVQYRMQRQRKGRLLQNRISFAFTGNEMSVEQYLRQEGVDDATIKRLLSNRFKGVDAKGISVAKFVSAEVAKLMELVNNNINLTKGIEEQYSDFVNALNEAMQKVPADLLNNETLRSAIETLPTIMRMYWQVDEMVNSAKTYESDLKRLNDKIKEAEETITFRPENMSDEAYEERTDQFSQVLKELIQLRDALMRQHLADMPAIVKLMTEANNAIEQMLLGGKQLLSEERKALERHKREVLQDAEMDITNYGQDYDALRADATRHKTSKERAKKEEKKRGLLSGIMSETFDSLDQMLRKMGSDSASGMGRTHQRIMGGLIQATNLMRANVNEVDDTINRKLQQLWGGRKGYRSLEDIIYQSQKIVVGSWNYARVANEARVVIEAGKPRTVYEEQTRTFNTELTLGQALYVLSAWNQADGRLKLEHNGFTQDDINSIMRAIADVDARWLDLMDFVIDELLPSRRDYYDEVHRRVNGAYMARVENYFPLKISGEEVYKEADLDAMSITEATIIPSAIINRTHNTKMIDLDVDFFKVLLENVTDMERWAAMVEIRQDMTTILSDTRTRNMMEQKYGVNFVADLERAMKVAVGTYTCKIPTTAEKALLYITRRWAGSRIAGRISTALKQLVGIGAYGTYATSWAYWLKVFKVMRHPVQNIKEALEMFPMLQQRWKSASSGDVLLQQFNHTVNVKTEGKLEWKQFDAWLDKVTRLGIMPNAAVDLFVSAVMAKATYEWEMERYLNQGFSREIAEQKAKIDAELSYNLTQQSAETMFIGSLQTSPSLVSRAATTFMNNPIANIRLGMQGFADIQRALKWQRVLHNERNRLAIEYRKQFIAEGMNEEQAGILAEQKALREVQNTKKGGVVWRGIKKMLWGYFLNATTFTLAGGIWLLCKYWDDDEKLDEMGLTGTDLLLTTVASPFQAIPVAKQLTDLLIYGKTSFIPMLDDALREFEVLRQYIENDNVSPSAVYAFSNAALSLGVGVDMNTWINMADGVVDMFNGDWDAGVAKLINKPKSQIKLLIGDRKDGETAKEYMTRVMRTMSIVDKNKIDVAELENFNFETGKWEKPTNISAAEKRKVSEIYRQYQEEYKKDMLKRCSEEVRTDYAEVVEKHAEIHKDMGVQDTKLALVKYYEQMVDTLTPEAASALNRLAVLQAEISATERSLDLMVSQDGKEYIDLLTEEFNLRKEFVAQYEIYKNLTE